MIMKAKFIILVSVGLCLAALTKAQIPGNFKDSRDLNRDRQEMAFERNSNIRFDRHEFKRDIRHRHHHRHHHGHSHRAV
jgi:hypothetical protein